MSNNTNANEQTLRDLLSKALAVYNTPEECVALAITFIDGLKAGAAQAKTVERKGGV